MRRLSAAAGLALALFLGFAADAADGRRWFADADSEIARLIYGTPESDDMVLSLTCEKESKTFWIWYAPQPVPDKAPEQMPFTIASESGQLELTAQGSRSELDESYSLEAKTSLTPDLARLLTEAKTLSLKVGSRKTDLPLDAIALKGAGDLVAACQK